MSAARSARFSFVSEASIHSFRRGSLKFSGIGHLSVLVNRKLINALCPGKRCHQRRAGNDDSDLGHGSPPFAGPFGLKWRQRSELGFRREAGKNRTLLLRDNPDKRDEPERDNKTMIAGSFAPVSDTRIQRHCKR
jgi:hypothetical protein